MSREHVSLFQPSDQTPALKGVGTIITSTHSLLQKFPAAVDRAAQNKKEERLWLVGSSPSDRPSRDWLHVDISESLEMRKDVNRGPCQSQTWGFSRTSSCFSPGVAASSHIAVASEAITIAVRSLEMVELVAETTIAPVVDTSAAAVSRAGSSAALSRLQRWGMLTDILTPEKSSGDELR